MPLALPSSRHPSYQRITSQELESSSRISSHTLLLTNGDHTHGTGYRSPAPAATPGQARAHDAQPWSIRITEERELYALKASSRSCLTPCARCLRLRSGCTGRWKHCQCVISRGWREDSLIRREGLAPSASRGRKTLARSDPLTLLEYRGMRLRAILAPALRSECASCCLLHRAALLIEGRRTAKLRRPTAAESPTRISGGRRGLDRRI